MYIERVLHPLFSDHSDLLPLNVPRSLSNTNGTISDPGQATTSRATAYIVLAVVLATLFLSLVGFFTVRRLPRTAQSPKKRAKKNSSPAKREASSQLPAMSLHTDASASTPPSPSSEGPLTPSIGSEYEHERVTHGTATNTGYRIYTHTPIQSHQKTVLSTSESPTPGQEHPVHCLDASVPVPSPIRPHGLPLWPVPEESLTIQTFPSLYDDEQLFYRPPLP